MLKQKILVVIIGALIVAGTLIITSGVSSNQKSPETKGSESSALESVQTTEPVTSAESVETSSETADTSSEVSATTEIEDTTSNGSEEIIESQTETETTAFEPIMTENGGEIEIILPEDQDGEGF